MENVPTVTEKQPAEEAEKGSSASEHIQTDVSTDHPQEIVAQSVLFDLSRFPKDKIALAESMGIPITEIANSLNAADSNKQMQIDILKEQITILANAISENPQKTIDLLKQAAQKEREAYVKANPQAGQGPQGQGGLAELMPLLGPLLGGGGSNPMMEAFMTAAMQNAMESMSYGTAFMKSIFTRMAPEFANEIATKMLPKVAAPT